jgi:hypothetical protein
MNKLSKSVFFPAIVAILVYLLVEKLWPENLAAKNSPNNVRGGDLVKMNVMQNLMEKILKKRAFKMAILGAFFASGYQFFQNEITELLIDEVFNEIALKETNGNLKIFCDIVKQHELHLHSQSMKEVILATTLSTNDKISLIKIKLDFIINGDFPGKTKFLLVSIFGIFFSCYVSGMGGILLILEALHELFQEGKISRALYKDILKIISKNSINVPTEHLL